MATSADNFEALCACLQGIIAREGVQPSKKVGSMAVCFYVKILAPFIAQKKNIVQDEQKKSDRKKKMVMKPYFCADIGACEAGQSCNVQGGCRFPETGFKDLLQLPADFPGWWITQSVAVDRSQNIIPTLMSHPVLFSEDQQETLRGILDGVLGVGRQESAGGEEGVDEEESAGGDDEGGGGEDEGGGGEDGGNGDDEGRRVDLQVQYTRLHAENARLTGLKEILEAVLEL